MRFRQAMAVAVAGALVCSCTAVAFVGRLTILRGLVGLQSVPGTLMVLPVLTSGGVK